jgi:cytochrome c peroxidase
LSKFSSQKGVFSGAAILVIAMLLFAWKQQSEGNTKGLASYPDDYGLPKMEVPEDNPITDEKVALGRKLFMDRRLSHNNTISCAMCHVPEQGFVVNELATAVGIEGRTNRRNAPTILNVGYYKHFFHDGRESTLENQVIGPLLAENEMGNPSLGYVLDRINSLPDYKGSFEATFNGKGPSIERVSQAIAAYERTMSSANSRFDQWFFASKSNALSKGEIRGFYIFSGKGGCVSCHSISKDHALFTDQGFHNLGVSWSKNNKALSQMMYDTVESKTFNVTLAPGIAVDVASNHFDKASETPKNDVGRFEITYDPEDSWKYKTPSLRNVEITAPYMHDGSMPALEAVVDFYDRGGEENPYKDPLIRPLGLTKQEKQDLVEFLKSLTGNNVKRLEEEARNSYVISAVP